MINQLKSDAKQTNNVKYITLASVEPVVTYYWSKHDFKLSMTCKEDPNFSILLNRLKTTMETERKLTANLKTMYTEFEYLITLQPKRPKRGIINKDEKSMEELQIKINQMTKQCDNIKSQRTKDFMELAKTGMSIVNLKRGGIDKTVFENKTKKDAAHFKEAMSDGLYMTFCLPKKTENKENDEYIIFNYNRNKMRKLDKKPTN
jgi:hypothetical protein